MENSQDIQKLTLHINYLESLLSQHNVQFQSWNSQQSIQAQEKQNDTTNSNKNNKSYQNLMPLETNLDKSLTKEQIERYSRQMLLTEINYEGQKKLNMAKVLVIGAGGIGSTSLFYLAGAGIGVLGLIDDDKVEESNLHRQIIHHEQRIGTYKSQSAKLSLQTFNSRIQINEFQARLSPQNAQQIISQYDIVIDASDNPKTRYLVNDACVIGKKILVSGSAIGWEGQITVYGYNKGPCYRCLYPESPKGGSVKSCGESGVVGMIPGLIGILQAVEAMKLIIGIKQDYILSQQLLIYDGIRAGFKKFKIRGCQKNCIVCGENPSLKDVSQYDYDEFVGIQTCAVQGQQSQSSNQEKFKNISWKNFIESKEYENQSAKFIDVRSDALNKIVNIKMFKSIPIDDLQSFDEGQLIQQVGEKHQTVYVMCRRGVNSKIGSNLLISHGFQNVINIEGGINKYGEQFDETIPFI